MTAGGGGSVAPPSAAIAPGQGGSTQSGAVRPPPDVETAGRDLPMRRSVKDRTTGLFNGERIVSGEDMETVADLRPFPLGAWPRAISAHVESHVAARMRKARIKEGTLVLNNPTCGNRGYDANWPETCEKYLPSLLEKNARLTVWATTDGGTTWWTKTYVGTGERIVP
jgi:hypothetical protein